MVLTGPNFDFFKLLLKRMFAGGDYRKLSQFEESGIKVCGPSTLRRWWRKSGLSINLLQWLETEQAGGLTMALPGRLGARRWLARAVR
jgi:hypothetical protein